MELLKRFKIVIFYFLLFLLFLIWNLILVPVNLDEIWNYGFAHSIYEGLVPYRDFNMVITPFYPFIMSLPFYIFGSSILVFHVTNAVMLTVLGYFLFKFIDKKALILIFFLLIPLSIAFPSYNLFLFFLFVIIICCEKSNVNDYLIGILLAFVCLTKQSVGVCMLLPSLYYFKDKKKLLKRFVGFLVPCFIFLIYLLCTNSFFKFLDLCLFGLFDFAVGNGKIFNLFWFLFVIIVIITLIMIAKDKKNITNYYVLMFYSIAIPLFDMYHFQIMFLSFLLIFLDKIKFLEKIKLKLFMIGIIIGVFFIAFIKNIDENIIYPNDINHFEYRLLDVDSIHFTKEINEVIKENGDKNIIFLCSNAYYFRIINDMEINYLDLINTGNWGYDGSNKLFDSVMNVENAIYIVDKSEVSRKNQLDKNVLKYVLKNGKKIKSIRIYDVYVIE